MTSTNTRSTERAHLDVPMRVFMLEGDNDMHDLRLDRIDERLSKILWALIGMLISFSTAAVLLALNLAVK